MIWSSPIRIEPRGHRIFECGGRWAIADNTGPTPDLTESGILWIERLPIKVYRDHARLWVWSVRHGRGTSVNVKIEGALYLVQHLDMKVEYDEFVKPFVELVRLSAKFS